MLVGDGSEGDTMSDIVTKVDWIDSIHRIREIGKEIAVLSAESKKLRLLVGDSAESFGGHIPTRDHPLVISSITQDDCESCVVTTIAPPEDSKNKDWNITSKDVPRI